MVDCEWTGGLCRSDHRRQPDPALSRIADRSDSIAASAPPDTRQGRCDADRGERSWPLFTNRWKSGAIAPAGHVRIASFHLDHSVPVWTYDVGDRELEASIWMEPGAHTTYAAWRLRSGPDCPDGGFTLRVVLLANNRDHHGTTSIGDFNPEIQIDGERLLLRDAGLFSLTVRAPGGKIASRRDWYRDFSLPIEAERGLDSIDHHLCVGEATIPLSPENGTELLRASMPTRRLTSQPRCDAVLIMTGRLWTRPVHPCGNHRRGLHGLRSPPMHSCFLARRQMLPMACRSSRAIHGSAIGVATQR
jgi:hypothetical protein